MKKKRAQKPKISKPLFWTPRILAIAFIVFISLFSLDVFGTGLGFWGTILGLFMHLIPSFIMIIALVIAWKRELVGAIVFTLLGLLYIIMLLMNPVLEWYMLSWAITVSGPAFLTGILFFMNWKRKK
jgi:hypothetical protein